MQKFIEIACVVFEKIYEVEKSLFFTFFRSILDFLNKVAGLTGMKFRQKYAHRAILGCRKAVRNFIEMCSFIGRVVFEKIEKGRKISNF